MKTFECDIDDYGFFGFKDEPPFRGNIYLVESPYDLLLVVTGLEENNKVIFINDNDGYLGDDLSILFKHITLLINEREPYLDNMIDEYTNSVAIRYYGRNNHTKENPAIPFLPFNVLREFLELDILAKYSFEKKKFIIVKESVCGLQILKKYDGSYYKERQQEIAEAEYELICDEIEFEQGSYKG